MLYTFVIDLKLTPDNKVKILELGQQLQSGAVGYQQAYGHCVIHDVIMPFYEKELNLPAFSLDPRANRKYGEDDAPDWFSLHRWVESRTLYEKASQLPEKADFDPGTTSTFSAIVSPFYLEGCYSAHILAPQKEHIAVVNDNRIFAGAARSKFLESQFFTPYIGSLAPEEAAILVSTPEQMAAKIKAAVSSDKIVLKLPEAARGEGVIIVDKDKVEDVLCFLVSSPDRAAPQTPDPSLSAYFNHKAWRHGEWNRQDVIVAQSFEKSAPVVNENDGQTYAPTMRAFVSLWKDKGDVKFTLHGVYWKFPKDPLAQGDSANNMISASPSKMRGGKVSEEHRNIVAAQLESGLPAALLQIDEMKMADVIRDCIKNPDDIRIAVIEKYMDIARGSRVLEELSRDESGAYGEMLAGHHMRTGAYIASVSKTGQPVSTRAMASTSEKIKYMGECYSSRVEELRKNPVEPAKPVPQAAQPRQSGRP